jgi:hypothetical protein
MNLHEDGKEKNMHFSKRKIQIMINPLYGRKIQNHVLQALLSFRFRTILIRQYILYFNAYPFTEPQYR